MLKLIVFLCGVSAVLCVCPRFSTITNLNLRDQVGIWNLHGVIRTVNPGPQVKCLQAQIIAQGDFTATPIHIDYHLTGDYNGIIREEEHVALVTNLQYPAMWQLYKNGTRHEFTIIHTDYIEYSVMATCAVINNVDVIEVFFASRYDRMIPEGIRNRLIEYISNPDYGLDTTLYELIQHGDDGNCEYDGRNSK